MLIDTHCHLDKLDLTPYKGILQSAIDAAANKGVRQILSVSVNMEDMAHIMTFTDQTGIYASCGVHPLHEEGLIQSTTPLSKSNLVKHKKIVAIGETGLDFFYEKSPEIHEKQKISFANHLKAAGELGLPVIVHTRNAKEDTLSLIRQHGNTQSAGVLHCFTQDYEMAKSALDENYLISISGIVTFGSAQDVRKIVRRLPLESLLVETDAPYLTPVPYRGRKNEPKYVAEVAQSIADIKGIPYEEVLEVTASNFHRIFKKVDPTQKINLPS